MFALDTNTLIYFFKGLGRVSEALQAVTPADVAVPAIVVFVLPFDSKAAKRAAETASALLRSGKGIGPMDTLIAGTALANDATLVTHHTKEFRRVRGLHLTDCFDCVHTTPLPLSATSRQAPL